MLEFFLPMQLPTATHQMQKVRLINGKPHFYEPESLKDARNKFRAYLNTHRPKKPLRGAIRLCTKWIWSADKTHPAATWKTSRPDTDNLIKLFKDCMTAEEFWVDDAQVASEITEKFYGEHEGVYVRLEAL